MSDECVLEFIGILAAVNRCFTQTAASIRGMSVISSVSVLVIPVGMQSASEYADLGMVISLAVNAELRAPVDDNRKAIGVSLLLRRSSGVWIVEAELGWSGVAIGLDAFDSREERMGDWSELASKVPDLAEWLSARLESEVKRL